MTSQWIVFLIAAAFLFLTGRPGFAFFASFIALGFASLIGTMLALGGAQ